jgi:uncharacterized membrane protein
MPERPPASTPTTWLHPVPAALHHPILAGLILAIVTEAVRVGLNIDLGIDWVWVPMAIWLLAALSLLVGIARRLPTQNVVGVTVVGGMMGLALDLLDVHTGLPFGGRSFEDGAGAQWASVPLLMVPFRLTLLLVGRGVARLVLKRHRSLEYYGFWVLGLATLLAVYEWVLIESVASHLHWWRWIEFQGGTLAGAPLAYWMGTPVSTLLVLAFLTPWLLNKRPVPQPVDFHPLWIWLLLGGWMGVYQLSLGHTSELGIHLLVTLMVVGAAWKGTRPEGPRSAVRAEYTKSDERLVH